LSICYFLILCNNPVKWKSTAETKIASPSRHKRNNLKIAKANSALSDFLGLQTSKEERLQVGKMQNQ
jgi:hypothetical protein